MPYAFAKAGEFVVAKDAFVGVGEDEAIIEVGPEGIAISGFKGHAIAGKDGLAIAEIGGMAQAGENGVIQFLYLDDYGKLRAKVGYIGENGLVPHQAYELDQDHNICPVTPLYH